MMLQEVKRRLQYGMSSCLLMLYVNVNVNEELVEVESWTRTSILILSLVSMFKFLVAVDD